MISSDDAARLRKDQAIRKELHAVQQEILAESLCSSYPVDVQQVLAYLGEHIFDESCDVDTVIDGAGVVRSEFHGRFKYHMRMPMGCYMEERRMEAAVRLLRHDNLELLEIAFSVGYANYRTFARAVKRKFRCSPTKYRKKIGESVLT